MPLADSSQRLDFAISRAESEEAPFTGPAWCVVLFSDRGTWAPLALGRKHGDPSLLPWVGRDNLWGVLFGASSNGLQQLQGYVKSHVGLQVRYPTLAGCPYVQIRIWHVQCA